MNRLVLAVVATTVALGSGCIFPRRQSNYYSINSDGSRSQRYARVNEYTSYHGVGQQAAIAQAFDAAEHAPPPKLEIEVFNSSLPPGITLEGSSFKIDPQAPYEAVGQYELGYWLDSAPDESQIQDDLVRLASVTQATTVVVQVQRVAHGDPRVEFLSGILLRKHEVATAAPVHTAALAPAHKARTHKQVALVYRASARGCLSADEFADEVSAKLGYSPWVPATGAPTTLSATLAASGQVVHATIALDADRQELTGATCKLATDAAISAILVRLDR